MIQSRSGTVNWDAQQIIDINYINTWNTLLNYKASMVFHMGHVNGTGISTKIWPFEEIDKCKESTQYDHAMPYKKACNIY